MYSTLQYSAETNGSVKPYWCSSQSSHPLPCCANSDAIDVGRDNDTRPVAAPFSFSTASSSLKPKRSCTAWPEMIYENITCIGPVSFPEVPMISSLHFQECTDWQSLVKCLDHRPLHNRLTCVPKLWLQQWLDSDRRECICSSRQCKEHFKNMGTGWPTHLHVKHEEASKYTTRLTHTEQASLCHTFRVTMPLT